MSQNFNNALEHIGYLAMLQKPGNTPHFMQGYDDAYNLSAFRRDMFDPWTQGEIHKNRRNAVNTELNAHHKNLDWAPNFQTLPTFRDMTVAAPLNRMLNSPAVTRRSHKPSVYAKQNTMDMNKIGSGIDNNGMHDARVLPRSIMRSMSMPIKT